MIDVNNEKKAIVGAFSIDEFDSSTSSYSFLLPFGYNSTANVYFLKKSHIRPYFIFFTSLSRRILFIRSYFSFFIFLSLSVFLGERK